MAKLSSRIGRRRKIALDDDSPQLHRTLGPVHLTLLGIGAIIGTGIFVLTGTAAAGDVDRPGAGPAIVLSFVITAFVCGLAAICYAEYASMVPISGSAYTYAYATFGELVAWIIGWDLLLEYAVGNVGVAIGWSGYLQTLLGEYFPLPPWLRIDPMSVKAILARPESFSADRIALARSAMESAPRLGVPIIMNLTASLVVAAITVVLWVGVRESARFNAGLVIVKFVLIALFCWFGVQHVDFDTHWADFAPNGLSGIMTGAALIFFAYVGFDAVSTTAEECRNPQRDIPIGMIASLVVCAVLYVLVAIVLTGMVPLATLNTAHPVSAALEAVGETTAAKVIAFGVIFSITSVLLVLQYGQSRIIYAMSRDRLLPGAMSRVGRFKTPTWAIIVTGIVVGIPAAFIDITMAAELTNIGTLFAFALVSAGVLYLRSRDPEIPRSFRVPAAWFICPLSVISCVVVMLNLPLGTWIRFVVWMALGLVVYAIRVWLSEDEETSSHAT